MCRNSKIMEMKVIGQYGCGCTYGPITKKKRLEYCSIHGADIQDEYPDFSELHSNKKSAEKKDRLEEALTAFTAVEKIDEKSPDKAVKQAVDEKVTAEQEALKAKNELERIRYEAQQKVIQAEAEANATIARAQAEAEAIQLIHEQIAQNPEYLQYIYIMQWDGVLPTYYGGEGLPFLMIPTNSTSP